MKRTQEEALLALCKSTSEGNRYPWCLELDDDILKGRKELVQIAAIFIKAYTNPRGVKIRDMKTKRWWQTVALFHFDRDGMLTHIEFQRPFKFNLELIHPIPQTTF